MESSLVGSLRTTLICTALSVIIYSGAVAGPVEDQITQRWMRHFPDPYTGSERASTLSIVGSRNIYVSGSSYVRGIGSMFVTLKYDETGERLWNALLGGASSREPEAMTTDASGNVYITGVHQRNYLTVKYNSFGIEQWRSYYDGTEVLSDHPYDLTVDSDGNVYVTGNSEKLNYSEIHTIKYNAQGEQQWVSIYSPENVIFSNKDQAVAIALDGMGNVLVSSQYITLKYDSDGNQLWKAGYSHPSASGNRVDMVQDLFGNVVVTGPTNLYATDNDFATVKYNAQGLEVWEARYNGSSDSTDVSTAMAMDNAHNVYVTGYSYRGGSGFDYVTIKYNASGEEQWVERYLDIGETNDLAYDIVLDSKANVYVTGTSGNLITTVKYDSQGVKQWERDYKRFEDYSAGVSAIDVGLDDHIYVSGYATSPQTGDDYVLIKYTPRGERVWVERYRGEAGVSRANDMTMDDNGNIYVAGETTLFQVEGDYLTVKFDADGNLLWYETYDGPASARDEAVAIGTDNRGNVYVTGKSAGNDTGTDYATIKYDSSGIEQWVSRLNGSAFQEDIPTDIEVDSEGNVVVTGYNMMTDRLEDYATVKYNRSGRIVWLERYPGEGADRAKALALDASGNAYVTGWSGSDVVTIKYTPAGEEAWTVSYTHPSNRSSDARDITTDGQGNVYVIGSGAGDYLTLKYSSTGEELWSSTYDDPAEAVDYANAVTVDRAGNVFVAGVTTGAGTENDITLVKYNADGAQQWAAVYDGSGNASDVPVDILAGNSGDVYVTGSTVAPDNLRDILLLKYAGSGEQLAAMTTEYAFQSGDSHSNAIELDENSDIIISGTSGRGYRWGVITLTKFAQRLSGTKYKRRKGSSGKFTLQQNYPNPFNPKTTIQYSLPEASQVRLAIYDLRGEQVATLVSAWQKTGWYSVEWDGRDYTGKRVSTGVYFYRLVAGQFMETMKMVFMR